MSGNYMSGISVVDFTNPAAAEEIAYADPPAFPDGFEGGDWSTYWYNGKIYQSDLVWGLLTWRLNDARVARYLKTSIEPAGAGIYDRLTIGVKR